MRRTICGLYIRNSVTPRSPTLFKMSQRTPSLHQYSLAAVVMNGYTGGRYISKQQAHDRRTTATPGAGLCGVASPGRGSFVSTGAHRGGFASSAYRPASNCVSTLVPAPPSTAKPARGGLGGTGSGGGSFAGSAAPASTRFAPRSEGGQLGGAGGGGS
jgi:hypothetical protein